MEKYLIILIIMFFSCGVNNVPIEEEPGEPGEQNVLPKTKNNNYQIIGVDQFGRSFTSITSFKKDKQVGLFFWLWIGQPFARDIYDATKILNMPNGLKLLTDFNYLDENISPNGEAHYWGEPLWGYYNSEDEWVIRKQMQMLTIAGIDFIFFDTTNAFIYKNVFMKVLSVIDEYQKIGWDPPKVVFYTHSRSLQTTRKLYNELYKPYIYPDTWYRIKGKPVIIAYTDPKDDLAEAKSRGDDQYVPTPLSNEILSFFYFFRPQWPSDPFFSDGFPWIEWIFPQPLHGNLMNVTVASHPAIPMSFSLTRGHQNWGRGWNVQTKQNITEDVDRGTFFQSQWDHALTINPDMISIGGWNEWIAYKQPYEGEYMLCDAVNKEFSRDIEPMKGGYQDAFYIQMIQNIRKYKGVSDLASPSESVSIDITASISQWDSIKYVQKNIDETYPMRDSYGGATTIRYTQAAPINKLQEIKVTHDDHYLYFYIKYKDDINIDNGKDNSMNLFIGIGDPSLKRWESYDYIIGKKYEKDKTEVGLLNNDFSTTTKGYADYYLNDNIIQIRIPRFIIGLNEETVKFYFKVASEVKNPSDIMSYYVSGCAMPMGRLSYMYHLR